jgi:hypothetical protein
MRPLPPGTSGSDHVARWLANGPMIAAVGVKPPSADRDTRPTNPYEGLGESDFSRIIALLGAPLSRSKARRFAVGRGTKRRGGSGFLGLRPDNKCTLQHRKAK